MSRESQHWNLTFNSRANGCTLALVSEPTIARARKARAFGSLGGNFESLHLAFDPNCSTSTVPARTLRHLGVVQDLRSGHTGSDGDNTRGVGLSPFEVSTFNTQVPISRRVHCSIGVMGEDAARLPVLAPASVGTPRAVGISTFERRRHIAVTACAECRAKKRKVGFN